MSSRSPVDGWLFPDAPPERLAVFRILVGIYAVLYLVIRLPAYTALADRGADEFDPVGALAPLSRPLPDTALVLLIVVVVVLGLAFTAGLAFRWIGPTFALGFLRARRPT